MANVYWHKCVRVEDSFLKQTAEAGGYSSCVETASPAVIVLCFGPEVPFCTCGWCSGHNGGCLVLNVMND